MNLDQQVCSLELAKRLKELGVNKPSIFWHMKRIDSSHFISSAYGCDCWVELPYDNEIFCHAYTVAELGEMLHHAASYKEDDNFYICILFNVPGGFRQEANTEANARAKMLIHLIENGHVKVEDIN